MLPNNGRQPGIVLKINGDDLGQDILVAMRSLRVIRSSGVASHANLRLDLHRADFDEFKVGADLEVAVEESSVVTVVFFGVIMGVGLDMTARRKELVIDAYDRSYTLGQSSTPKVYAEQTIAEILRSVADEHRLSADIPADFGGSEKFEHVQQVGTAHQFIDALVHRAGGEWFVDGSKLIFRERPPSSAASVELEAGEGGALVSFVARYTATEQYRDVTVRGWDPINQQELVGQAEERGSPNDAGIIAASKGKVGAKSALSWPRNVVSSGDAANLATSLRHRMDQAAMTGRGECWATPTLKPGDRVKIGGVDPQWNGHYYVTAVEHVVSSSQPFMTKFTVGALEPGSLVDIFGRSGEPTANRLFGGLTIGEVTNIADDKNLGRVKFKLPYLADSNESGWARVLQPGAGSERGFQFVPEVGDEVVVAYENGDSLRPLVLGGLWNNTAKPPPKMIEGGKVVRRAWTSRLGHEVLINDGADDSEQYVSITTAKKKATIRIAENQVDVLTKGLPIWLDDGEGGSIEINGKGEIEILGKKITLESEQGDVIVNGVKITMTATQAATLESKSAAATLKGLTAEVSGQMTTAVKGPLGVAIN